MSKQIEAVEFFNSIPDDFLVNNTDISRYTNFDSYIKTYDGEDWDILKQELIDNPTSSLKEIIDSMWVNYDNDIKLGEVYYISSGFDDYIDCLAQWGKENGLAKEKIKALCDDFSVYVQNEWEKQHAGPEKAQNDVKQEVTNNELIRNATFTSIWNDGQKVTTNCMVNLVTREVFDIEINDSNNIEKLNELECEYITIDGEEHDVYNSEIFDNSENYEDFWYNIETYPHLSVCDDYKYLIENLSDKALIELERIIDAYGKGKIDIEIVRDEKEQIKFEESFSLIVNDKDYEKSGFEDIALKWYEGFEDTGFFVDCFSEIDSNSYCFDVDYTENGKQKSFQIGIAAKEKPDNLWLAQRISNYFSTRYKGSLETTLDSVTGIDVKITDFRGEYVDSDEIYGDDLKALFEHLKTERYKLFVDDEVHYAMLTKSEVNRINKDIAGELNCQFEITDEKGEKIESGIIDFIEKDENVFYFCPDTVTGYIGQVLDECEIDEKARVLLSELYNGALKEINGDELEKPGLDDVISAAKQRQGNAIENNVPNVEPER